MPVYKDKDRGTWYCCFYYTDWQGEQQRKTKRGFTKQKDAKEWERAFLDKLQENPQMTMASLISLYNTDMASRLRVSTMNNKEHLIRTKILPYFGKMKISDIKATTVRQWQNQLMGDEYAETKLLKVISKSPPSLLSCSRSQACASRFVLNPRFCDCFRSPFQSV